MTDQQFFQTAIVLLCASGGALVVTALSCLLLVTIFPWFRSGERKPGNFRADQSSGAHHVVAVTSNGKNKKKLTVGSHELPLVGGVALLIGIVSAAVGTGVWLTMYGDWSYDQWVQLGIVVLATVGFGMVGFVDDWRKVHKGTGITELQKAGGVIFVSLLAAIGLNRLLDGGLSAKHAYPPYIEFPFIGKILENTHFAWIVFFLLMTVAVTSTSSLAADFTDGMDGLAGGVTVSAALALAVVFAGFQNPSLVKSLIPSILLLLVLAGAALGYLPFNWPSAWAGRGSTGPKRRARLIMGDTGSLAIGGLLALVAIIGRMEFLLLIICGIFLLEGLSALISARILVRFYRIALFNERFRAKRGFPHTELPLPFLATPMHHHYDLLGWNRKKLVYRAWLLSALLGVLGVASAIGSFTWERYLARTVAILLLIAIWQAGTVTRGFFLGLVPPGEAPKDGAVEGPRRLALFYGVPFRLFGWPLYRLRTSVSTTVEALEEPVEHLNLWQRLSVFDARALLGYYSYRAGDLADANRVWSLIPSANLEVRPEIRTMLFDARSRLDLERDVESLQLEPAAKATVEQAANGPVDESKLWSANTWAAATMPPVLSDSMVLPVVNTQATSSARDVPVVAVTEPLPERSSPHRVAPNAVEDVPSVPLESETDPTAKRVAIRNVE